VSGGT